MMKRANSVDRISALPDSTLSIILSSIPTNNAVATSVLSKRWKSLWKTVHNLDFNLDLCISGCNKRCHENCSNGRVGYEDIKFARFVNHVLLHHDGGFLNKFSLVWKPTCIPSQVISWIRTAITRNVHELYLCVDNSNEQFDIPSGLFSCETLKSLHLDGNMIVFDSIVVCLPRLERLELVSIHFQSAEAFQKLISGCSVLNYLSVTMDMDIITGYYASGDWDTDTGINLFTFIISSTSLRRLILHVVSESHLFELVPYCSLELEASSLQYLCLVGYVPNIVVRDSLRSMVKADFSLSIGEDELDDADICNSLVEAIRAFDCAKSLRLSEFVLVALSRATIGLSTKFKRLTELTTAANCCYCSSIQDFIQSSDSLEVLIVNKVSDCLDYDNSHAHSNWTTPFEVPRCLSNSLKRVQFDDYCGFDYEYEMISYMLMHGSALKVMTINCELKRDDLKLKLVQEICEFPRKSPSCKVKFNSAA